ncbi:ATP-binding protein [Nocardioides speluncae]|uniref:ATP-binding protein n=1 Tax=Nocardioides speluncae TaxID=2670337 RepID=UPI000D68A988|nr:ATP-binding protein [Nocardioides speluncae]
MTGNAVEQALAIGSAGVGEALLVLAEDQWFDRKSVRIAPRDLAESLVAFANAEGGTVVVGLHSGRVEGVRHLAHKVNDLRQAAMDHTVPTVRVAVEEIECINDKQEPDSLLVFRVEPGEMVHEMTRGDCYLRVGDESRRLSFHQRQELHYDRGSAPYDGTPLAGVTLSALHPLHTASYLASVGSQRPLAAVLRARSLLTRDEEVTVAAYLLFGEHPQDLLPHAHVRVLRYTASDRGTGARQSLAADGDQRVEGPLPDVLNAAANGIGQWIAKRRVLAPGGRFVAEPIVPADAWLEGLVNAVIHRSYSAAGDNIRVSLFPDRIEIESPGRFPGLVDPRRPMEISRYARNPRIARVCTDLGIAQELGEGIPRMFDEMRAKGLSDPVYTQTAGSVRLVLSATSRLPDELRGQLPHGAEGLLDLLRQAGQRLGTGDLVDLSGLSRPTVTKAMGSLREAGLVVWDGKSAKDPRATWSLSP